MHFYVFFSSNTGKVCSKRGKHSKEKLRTHIMKTRIRVNLGETVSDYVVRERVEEVTALFFSLCRMCKKNKQNKKKTNF